MKSISKLKKELDKWFSLFIRLRDATNEGLCQCFTCGKVAHYKDGMQCGHFMSRRHMATRFHELNQIQCIKCNMFEQGMSYVFGLNLNAHNGKGTAEKLLIKSKKIVKLSNDELISLITKYKNLLDKMQ